MNLRKEHRREQGEAARHDFNVLWNDTLLAKAKSLGVYDRQTLVSVRHIALLAFSIGAFPEWRKQIHEP